MIYVASKTSHAPVWRQLRAAGLPINSTWIDEAGVGETNDWPDLWTRCLQEAGDAKLLFAYRNGPEEILKGAMAEIGVSLFLGHPTYLVGHFDDLSIRHHPNATLIPTMTDLLHLFQDKYKLHTGVDLHYMNTYGS